MKRAKVISLAEYRARRTAGLLSLGKAAAGGTLLEADHLRQLLDRNLSIEVWKQRN